MSYYNVNSTDIDYPIWLGYEPFHSSHRSNLLRKNFEYYAKFNWLEDPLDPYVWLDVNGVWYKHMVMTGERIYL